MARLAARARSNRWLKLSLLEKWSLRVGPVDVELAPARSVQTLETVSAEVIALRLEQVGG